MQLSRVVTPKHQMLSVAGQVRLLNTVAFFIASTQASTLKSRSRKQFAMQFHMI